jgi:hypothetical protein
MEQDPKDMTMSALVWALAAFVARGSDSLGLEVLRRAR